MNQVVLPNRGEFLADLDERCSNKDRWKALQAEAHAMGSALTWGGADKTIVSYEKATPGQVEVEAALGYNTRRITVPRQSLLLSSDLRSHLMTSAVADHLGEHVILLPYGMTWELMELVDHLESQGVTVRLPFSISSAAHARVMFLNTKLGFRTTHVSLNAITDVLLPDAVVVDGHAHLKRVLDHWPFETNEVLVKGSRGAGGMVQQVVKRGREELKRLVASLTAYWPSSIFVIEEIVRASGQMRHPTVSGIIHDSYSEIFGVTNHWIPIDPLESQRPPTSRWSKQATILGFQQDAQLQSKLVSYAKLWADQLISMGYRGWFCIDCIVSDSGRIFATEINCRRSVSTMLHELASGGLLDWPILVEFNTSIGNLPFDLRQEGVCRMRVDDDEVLVFVLRGRGRGFVDIIAACDSYKTAEHLLNSLVSHQASIIRSDPLSS